MSQLDRVCLGLMALSACGCGDSVPGSQAADRTVIGDTTIVRSAVSAWSDTASLVEEVSIGVLEGDPEYQFGSFVDITVDEAGGVYVFDGQDPALRYYDASGAYVRTLGREGEGPGEYFDVSLGLAVRSDGRLVMRDPRNGRLNVYDADGTPSESWTVSSGLYTADATTLDTADHMYLKILTARPEPDRVWPIGLLHMDGEGQIVDTIVPPVLPNEPRSFEGVFGRSKVWTLSPLGGFVVGVNDRYMFEHHRPDGTVLRVERDVEPVLLTPGEREEYEDYNAWQRRTDDADPPALPDAKPFYRSVAVGREGRFWVRRYVEAVKDEPRQSTATPGMEPPPALTWREPVEYDVFESDGGFLGTVRVPRRTTLSVFKGDVVWGIRRGSFDEPQVVRFRVSVED